MPIPLVSCKWYCREMLIKRIVNALQTAGVTALGISGVDCGFIYSITHDGQGSETLVFVGNY